MATNLENNHFAFLVTFGFFREKSNRIHEKTDERKLIIFVLFVRHQEKSDQPYRIHEKTEERKTNKEVAGGKFYY